MIRRFAFCCFIFLTSPVLGELTVADIFSDNMVLQQDITVPVWGRGDSGKTVEVRFGKDSAATKVDKNGFWKANLTDLLASDKSKKLTVRCGDETVTFKNVLVGEVWYASGQSNMAWQMKSSAQKLKPVADIIKNANFPHIRYRAVKPEDSNKRQSIIGDGQKWSICHPSIAGNYSAVAFLFAKRLHEELGVPIGIIESAWGGHPIEPFIPKSAFVGHPVLEKELELGEKSDLDGLRKMKGGVYARNGSWLPGAIFNTRVAPVAPFAVRGAVWYQAESNCGRGEDPRFYSIKMKALMQGWRETWDQPDMPIYFIQLPQYDSAGWTPMRDEQRRAASDPKNGNTGLVVTIDLALDGIHPANKVDVANRLARWPLAKQYDKNIVPSGPMFRSMKIEESTIAVYFDHTGEQLLTGHKVDMEPTHFTKEKEASGFEIVGKDQKWHPAKAMIEKDHLVLSCKQVTNPIGVRYGWAGTMPKDKLWNLYNDAGLPASPFISDSSLVDFEPSQE